MNTIGTQDDSLLVGWDKGMIFVGPPTLNVILRKGTEHAIIGENNGVHGVQMVNEIGDKALLCCSEPYHPPS